MFYSKRDLKHMAGNGVDITGLKVSFVNDNRKKTRNIRMCQENGRAICAAGRLIISSGMSGKRLKATKKQFYRGRFIHRFHIKKR